MKKNARSISPIVEYASTDGRKQKRALKKRWLRVLARIALGLSVVSLITILAAGIVHRIENLTNPLVEIIALTLGPSSTPTPEPSLIPSSVPTITPLPSTLETPIPRIGVVLGDVWLMIDAEGSEKMPAALLKGMQVKILDEGSFRYLVLWTDGEKALQGWVSKEWIETQ